MDASHIHTNINLLPKAEIALAKQCSQLNITCSNMASLVNIRNVLGVENHWTRHQLYYQNRLSQQLKQLNCNASSAEKLIDTFEKRTDTNFMYLTFQPTEGLMLMTGNHVMFHVYFYYVIFCYTFNYLANCHSAPTFSFYIREIKDEEKFSKIRFKKIVEHLYQ